MHSTPQLLDALAGKLGGVTDYRLSKVLGTSPQTVAHWRKGTRHLSPLYALKLSQALDWPAEYVLACVEHERSPTEDVRVVWARLARNYIDKISAAVVTLIVAGGSFFAPSQSHAAPFSVVHDIHYTKYGRPRRATARWWRFVTWFPVHQLAG